MTDTPEEDFDEDASSVVSHETTSALSHAGSFGGAAPSNFEQSVGYSAATYMGDTGGGGFYSQTQAPVAMDYGYGGPSQMAQVPTHHMDDSRLIGGMEANGNVEEDVRDADKFWVQMSGYGSKHEVFAWDSTTFADIRQQLQTRHGFLLGGDHRLELVRPLEAALCIDESKNVKEFLENYPELLDTDSSDCRIVIELNTFCICVVDGLNKDKTGHKIPVTGLCQSNTIGEVLAALRKQKPSENVDEVSFNGRRLETERVLQHIGINYVDAKKREESEEAPFEVVHCWQITVVDNQCDTRTSLSVKPFWNVTELMQNYLSICKREEHISWKLEVFSDTPDARDLAANRSETLSSLDLFNGLTLEYSVGTYEILVYDGGDEPVRVTVWDQWQLKDVKEEYSKLSEKPVLEEEKFLSDERQLEDGQPLWKLRIREGEQLVIERVADDVAVDYICGECGTTVPLKSADNVKCRHCFHPILFKKRTGRVCTFDCR